MLSTVRSAACWRTYEASSPPRCSADSGWERLQPLANRLPACAADSRFGFEFHLSDPTPTGDFFVISSPHTGLAEFFRGLTEETAAGLVGTDFTAFLNEQAHHPDSFLTRTGKGIILEYDLSRSPPGQYGVPGIFIVTGGYPEADPVELYEDPAALVAALQSVAGWEPDVAESRHVERACAALADCGVYVSHAGVMPGRAERAIRLVALGVDGAKVAEGLRRVQWPGDPWQAMAVLSEFAGLVSPSCGLGISVTPPRCVAALGSRTHPEESGGFSQARVVPPGPPGMEAADRPVGREGLVPSGQS